MTAHANAERLKAHLQLSTMPEDFLHYQTFNSPELHLGGSPRHQVQELALWMYFLGAAAAMDGSLLQTWFIEGCVRTALSLKVENGSDLEEIVSQFFYLEHVHYHCIQKIGSLLVSRVQPQVSDDDCLDSFGK